MSKIEWTEKTWNPVVGCTWASAGCDHCYAATMTRRLEAMGQSDYAGLTTHKHFNGVVRCLPEKLSIPMNRKKPTMYFVNSMSDLFHKDVPFEFIDQVFGVMAKAYWHTFQVLTKRPERMAEYFSLTKGPKNVITRITEAAQQYPWPTWKYAEVNAGAGWSGWPIRNVHLGTSCEDQRQFDIRVPYLCNTPAAVRFLSLEPLLGPVDLQLCKSGFHHVDELGAALPESGDPWLKQVDWVIVGGESGHGARGCNIEWVRSLRDQCQSAGVPCFVKQLGALPFFPFGGNTQEWQSTSREYSQTHGDVRLINLRDKKGGDWNEWPDDLRVRQFPLAQEPA